MSSLDAIACPAAASLNLATRHVEIDVVTARIAGDDLESGVEHRIGNLGKLKGVGGRAAGADHKLAIEHVLVSRDAMGVPGDADAHLVVGRAKPVEPGGLELGRAVAEQR